MLFLFERNLQTKFAVWICIQRIQAPAFHPCWVRGANCNKFGSIEIIHFVASKGVGDWPTDDYAENCVDGSVAFVAMYRCSKLTLCSEGEKCWASSRRQLLKFMKDLALLWILAVVVYLKILIAVDNHHLIHDTIYLTQNWHWSRCHYGHPAWVAAPIELVFWRGSCNHSIRLLKIEMVEGGSHWYMILILILENIWKLVYCRIL